jgi:putative transposase
VYFITYKTFLGEKHFLYDWQKEILLSQILLAVGRCGLELRAYAILSNHYHLMVECTSPRLLKKSLQLINGGSSFRLNKKLGAQQRVWGEHYNYAIVDDNALTNILAYILKNPLKHELVNSIEELKKYSFVSYDRVCEEFGKEVVDELIRTHHGIQGDWSPEG